MFSYRDHSPQEVADYRQFAIEEAKERDLEWKKNHNPKFELAKHRGAKDAHLWLKNGELNSFRSCN
jgi:hypothetical protein